MRLTLACIVALVLVLPAAARTDLSVVAPAPVVVMAADGERGQRVALLSPAANRGCGAVSLWKVGRPLRQLGPVPCGPRTSTGRGAYGLSFGGALLWATYTGGNFREHTLWRSVRAGIPFRYGRGRAVARVTHNVDEPSPLLVGEGDDAWASYAVGNTAYVLSGATSRFWRLPAKPLGVIAHGPYLTVRRADGPVSVYASWQKDEIARMDYAPGEALAAKAHSGLFAVLRRGALDVRNVYGTVPDTIRLPAARSYGDDHCGIVRCPLAELRLADLQGILAVYIHGRAIHVLRWTDERDVVIRRPTQGPVHAELEATGLSYSSGRRVFFIPRAEIDRRLRSG
jgi:hypothetical protein